MSGYKTPAPKLKIYDVNNTPKTNVRGKAFIHITKNGIFTFNKPMVEKLGLKIGDSLRIANDEANPKDWYLLLGEHPDGFKVRKKTADTVLFNAAGIADLIFKSLKTTPKPGRILIGAEPVEVDKLKVWPLITSPLGKEASDG